jgi:hypothetical protein
MEEFVCKELSAVIASWCQCEDGGEEGTLYVRRDILRKVRAAGTGVRRGKKVMGSLSGDGLRDCENCDRAGRRVWISLFTVPYGAIQILQLQSRHIKANI